MMTGSKTSKPWACSVLFLFSWLLCMAATTRGDTITLKNGTCLRQHYDIDGTTPDPALQEKALLEKFLRLTEPVLGNRAQALAEAILDFETLGTVNRFMAWTRPSHI